MLNHYRLSHILAAVIALWTLLVPLSIARADVDPVNLTISQDDVGFMGLIKPGVWNPIRLTLENPSAQPMAVDCRWTLTDFDKDIIIANRRVTVPARRKQTVWVYGCVPVTVSDQPEWKIDIVEADTKQVLAKKIINTYKTAAPNRKITAVSGGSRLGLGEFSVDIADSRLLVHQHELMHLVRGLESANLPDRWYGYDGLDTVILTPEIDPARIPQEVFAGLREWIKRGGHAIIIMPSANEAWSQSPGKDFLPEAELVRKESMRIPKWLGDPNKRTELKVDYYAFVPKNNSTGILYADDDKNAVIVSRQLGFGAVTVIGVNIAEGNLESLGLPNGRFNIWHRIFGWHSPAYSRAALEGLGKDTSPMKLKMRGQEYELDTLLVNDAGSIKSNIQIWTVAAIFIFAVYWLLAGPVSYLVLRVRKETRHSWVAFLGIVVIFTAGVWVLAWFSRPKHTQQNHITFYDLDVRQKLVRCQSWAQVNCPDFAKQDVALAPGERNDNPNTVASPGMVAEKAMARGWVDVQTIDIDAAAPNKQWVPFRSSAKLFQLRYLGKQDPMDAVWPVPTGTVAVSPRSDLSGTLKHNLPGTLSNVILVYCPGSDATPLVWNTRQSWAPGQDWNLTSLTATMPLLLVRDPAGLNYTNRKGMEMEEGFMGMAFKHTLNGVQRNNMHFQPNPTALQDDTRTSITHAISFFDSLPAPDFLSLPDAANNQSHAFGGGFDQADALVRTQSRSLDLTRLTTQPKLIVIGELPQSPNPTPLTLGAEPVEGTGLTIVRYIFDVK